MEDKKDYFIIGKILKPFGISGEVKVLPLTDNVTRFKGLDFVYLKKNNRFVKISVVSSRIANKFALLKLEKSSNRDEAEKYRNEYLYIDRENAVKLEKGSYYYYDIWKCKVFTTSGDELGIVENIQNAGSCDVYEVRLKEKGKTILIPAISDVVKSIDIGLKRIEIEPLEGLF